MQQDMKNRLKRIAIAGGLELASAMKSLGVMRDAGGTGAAFTLHHVRPYVSKAFEPNRHLEITPDYLDLAIRALKADGYEFLSAAALPERLANPDGRPRFVCMTLDDGNRNNAEYALPVFERHGVPFTIFVAQGLSERTHSMWWETLAVLLGDLDTVRFDFGAGERSFDLTGSGARQALFDRFAAFVHGSDEAAAVAEIDALARRHALEPLDIVRSLIMDRAELQRIAAHPLASLGAHTVSHRAVARLDEGEARAEMTLSANYLAIVTGTAPATIAFPYGTRMACSDREARLAAETGFTVGFSTRPGIVRPGMATTLLPRLSLNGFYQKPRYAAALASGIPMRLMRQRP